MVLDVRSDLFLHWPFIYAATLSFISNILFINYTYELSIQSSTLMPSLCCVASDLVAVWAAVDYTKVVGGMGRKGGGSCMGF